MFLSSIHSLTLAQIFPHATIKVAFAAATMACGVKSSLILNKITSYLTVNRAWSQQEVYQLN